MEPNHDEPEDPNDEKWALVDDEPWDDPAEWELWTDENWRVVGNTAIAVIIGLLLAVAFYLAATGGFGE